MSDNEPHFSYRHQQLHHQQEQHQQQSYPPPLVISTTSSTPRASFQPYFQHDQTQQPQHQPPPTSPGRSSDFDPLSPVTPLSLYTPRSNQYFPRQQNAFDASIAFSPDYSYNPHTPHGGIRGTNYGLSPTPYTVHDDKGKAPEQQPVYPIFEPVIPQNAPSTAFQYNHQVRSQPSFDPETYVDNAPRYHDSYHQQEFRSVQPPPVGRAISEADLTEYFGSIWQNPLPIPVFDPATYEGGHHHQQQQRQHYPPAPPQVHTPPLQAVPMDIDVGLGEGWMPPQDPFNNFSIAPPLAVSIPPPHAPIPVRSVLAPPFTFDPPAPPPQADLPPLPGPSRPLLPPPSPSTPRPEKQPRTPRKASPPYVKKKSDARGGPKIKNLKARAKSFNPFTRKTLFLNLIKGKTASSPKVLPYSVTADSVSGEITLAQDRPIVTPYNTAVPEGDVVFCPPDASTVLPTPSRTFSDEFPEGHCLDPCFAGAYRLKETLGSGGFGFVMTALHVPSGIDVAVKFILRAKIPPEHLVEDPVLGSEVPIEALILRLTDHKGIVKFLDFYEDGTFFYLVQELHGTPWHKPNFEAAATKVVPRTPSLPDSEHCVSPTPIDPSMMSAMLSFKFGSTSPLHLSPPSLLHDVPLPMGPASPRVSPPQQQQPSYYHHQSDSYFSIEVPRSFGYQPPSRASLGLPQPPPPPRRSLPPPPTPVPARSAHFDKQPYHPPRSLSAASMPPPPTLPPSSFHPPLPRPNLARRPSHDLFECIEQHRMLDERRARYVFKQVVDTVAYLESMGISHRDIKDENLVVDAEFNVKLIDFGSAVVRDLNAPEPYYDKFFGTISFASSEILKNQAYRAPPAEIWSLGVLLSFLVTGESPFPDKQHAIDGEPVFVRSDGAQPRLSVECVDLIRGCLIADPDKRLTIDRVQRHPWFGIP
ncbi:hypothetical protein FRB90_006004 [Tulasnella sp. 427]|nr:hypothetical protein FRB90_006004 [Tulasnella sp. 427]